MNLPPDRSRTRTPNALRAAQPPGPTRCTPEIFAQGHQARRPALAPFTHEQLTQKYKQVLPRYDGYKSKFGARLEREWSDLATFIQFMRRQQRRLRGGEKARGRLDAFRGRMRSNAHHVDVEDFRAAKPTRNIGCANHPEMKKSRPIIKAVQARRGEGTPRRDRCTRHDGHRGQRLWTDRR